jgi:hypothetical protein
MSTTTEKRRRRKTMSLCEWCHTSAGDFDIAPPAEEFATMICIWCYVRLHNEIMELQREEEEEEDRP